MSAPLDSPPLEPSNPRFQNIDKAALLSHCQLFAGLSQWELKSIAQLMRLVEFRKDEIVYREGGESDSFYVVVSGRFEAYVQPQQRKNVLAYLKRGDYFGEMSLLTGEAHSATLHALSDSLLLELKKDDFKKIVEHNAVISLELGRRLSTRLKGGASRSRSLFKSDVISVFGNEPRVGRTSFSINLAASLFQETHQKTVLLDMSPSGHEIAFRLGLAKKVPLTQFRNIENAPPDSLAAYLLKHPVGFEVLSVAHEHKDVDASHVIIPLLNQLAVDYRFIVIDLPTGIDDLVFKVLTQSDTVFFVTDSHLNNVTELKETIADFEKNISFSRERVAVVLNEALMGVRTDNLYLRKEFFTGTRCFVLPTASFLEEESGSGMPCVVDEPDAEYSRTVRHIARFVSNNLVGLALGSGAALGLAHIGVLKVLEREKIPVDIIAGSSIGALIGALYAVYKDSRILEETALEVNLFLLFTRLVDINMIPMRSFLHSQKVMGHFKKHLGNKTFEDCRIPLKIVGANLSRRQIHVYDSGLITDAVRASIAIPAIFKPIFVNGDMMVDGGILSPLPIRALQDAGANKVIAVNVFPTSKDMKERSILAEEAAQKEEAIAGKRGLSGRAWLGFRKFLQSRFSPTIFDVLMNTIQSMESEIAEIEGSSADVLIRPVISSANWVDFYRPAPFIKRGEEETVRLLPKIKALVLQQNA